jgi:hypothetical protein
MTTRLKVLSGLLVLSIIYAAITSISDSRQTTTRKTDPPQVNSATATRNSSIAKSDDLVKVNNYSPFKPIQKNDEMLVNWGSDPFRRKTRVGNQQKNNVSRPVNNLNPNLIAPVVDLLSIESVAVIGETKIVIINGERYREGDLVNNMFIEKIDRKNITFRSGKTKIIRSVGS